MLLKLSLRRKDSTIFFGSPQWWYADGDSISTQQAIELCAGKRMLILAHGYNVTDAFDAYSRMMVNLETYRMHYDVVVGVEWPGSQLTPAFIFAVPRATKAGKMLAVALEAFKPKTLDIEGHSLGCRVACSAVKAGMRPRLVVLAGAAIDDESVQAGEEFGESLQRVPKVLVAYSAHDAVLRKAYKFALWDNALGLTGPEDPALCYSNIKAINLSHCIIAHSGYKYCPAFYQEWSQLVEQLTAMGD